MPSRGQFSFVSQEGFGGKKYCNMRLRESFRIFGKMCAVHVSPGAEVRRGAKSGGVEALEGPRALGLWYACTKLDFLTPGSFETSLPKEGTP